MKEDCMKEYNVCVTSDSKQSKINHQTRQTKIQQCTNANMQTYKVYKDAIQMRETKHIRMPRLPGFNAIYLPRSFRTAQATAKIQLSEKERKKKENLSESENEKRI